MKTNSHIVVVSAGWVFVGTPEVAPKGYRKLGNASVIRVWGTTNGLGEIAMNGPTTKTVLDPCGTVTLPETNVLIVMECAWGEK